MRNHLVDVPNRIGIVWCLLGLTAFLQAVSPLAPAAEPVAQVPAVRVVVDPRVELMSLIFRLAGNREYRQAQVKNYAAEVDTHFEPVRNHAAIQQARKLRQTRSVSFDACMSMAVHLTGVDTLQERMPFEPRPHGLDSRWPSDGARTFLQETRQFVKESRFPEFLAAHRTLYETTETRMRALLTEKAHLEWFDDFFGARPQASFTVVLGLLNGGCCYGPHYRLPDGKEELYCVLGVWKTDDDGLPIFEADMLETVVHEFCHSYANEIVDRHADELKAAGEKLFPQVAAAMKRQAYGNWKTMMYESLVRASTIRYLGLYEGPSAARLAIEAQKKRQFPWIGELVDLLGQYENDRQRYPTWKPSPRESWSSQPVRRE